MIKIKPSNNQRGSFLVAAMIIIMFMTAIGLSLSGLIAEQYSHTKYQLYDANATQVAEAGIEESVHALNADDSFGGYTTPVEFFNNVDQGKGIFTTTVSENADGKSKSIISIGEVYRHSTDPNPYITRKIKVTTVGTTSGSYSVYTGPGGLILDNHSSIINSPVFVNGFIELSNSAQIGTDTNPVDVDVANEQCPASGGPTYPQVCTDGTQPISLLNSSHIYGNVCATGQTDSNGISGGNGGTGLKSGCIAPPASPPSYDRQAQIDAVTTTGSANDNTYTCGNGQTKTWPSNLKLTGSVSLSNNCRLTITGNVYITGNLSLSNSSQILVADSVNNTQPVVIVDGTISINNSSSMAANSSGTGAKFISFKNSTGDPSATVSGSDLKNSQSVTTVSVGNSARVPGMIFDAYWGKLVLGNASTIGAVAGQTIELNNSGNIIFGTKLSSGVKTWSITSYQRLYQ